MSYQERGRRIAEAKRSQPNRYQGGRVPFGYQKTPDGMLEKDPETYPILEAIRQLANQEGMRSREIEKSLREREIPISHMTIYRILKKNQR